MTPISAAELSVQHVSVNADTLSFRRLVIIALTAFLTVVDLFAAQAILPSLTAHYGVSPAQMAVAVNASTIGMAIASLLVALFGAHFNRRRGILFALLLLALPTTLLAHAPGLSTFFALRVIQGLLMASAFGLTLAYLGESLPRNETARAFAAYITGNVASNLVGRFIAAAVADRFGLAPTFYCLALLNAAGAFLVYLTVQNATARSDMAQSTAVSAKSLKKYLSSGRLLATCAIGFCILFAFIGTFSFVNFVLMRDPFGVSMMDIGLVYFVFLPSIITTAFAGQAVAHFGARVSLIGALGVSLAGLPLLLVPSLAAVLSGMALVAAGTFFAQAIATGYANRAVTTGSGAATGLYLACYFIGGIAGAAILGHVFDAAGWPTCVAGIAAALLVATCLASALKDDISASQQF